MPCVVDQVSGQNHLPCRQLFSQGQVIGAALIAFGQFQPFQPRFSADRKEKIQANNLSPGLSQDRQRSGKVGTPEHQRLILVLQPRLVINGYDDHMLGPYRRPAS